MSDRCNQTRQQKGLAYPRTCAECGLGPCRHQSFTQNNKYMPAPGDDYTLNQSIIDQVANREGAKGSLSELRSKLEIAEKKLSIQAECLEFEIKSDKELRVGIDAQLQKLKDLKPTRERSLAITKLQEAVMWLGMDLKRINELSEVKAPNPYPNSYDPSNTKIEPTADGLKL